MSKKNRWNLMKDLDRYQGCVRKVDKIVMTCVTAQIINKANISRMVLKESVPQPLTNKSVPWAHYTRKENKMIEDVCQMPVSVINRDKEMTH